MGQHTDAWSIVHFSAGMLTTAGLAAILPCKKWVILFVAVMIHQMWELYENSDAGIKPWNTGRGKKIFNSTLCMKSYCPLAYEHYEGDSATNSAGDTVWFTLGATFVLTILANR